MFPHLQTLVLNADGRPLSIISWKRAIVLVHCDGMYELDFYAHRKVRDGHGRAYTIPAVVIRKRQIKRDYRNPPFSRKNILLRDSLTCQYCGRKCHASELEMEHVIPRSRWAVEGGGGSPTCWENIVAACTACNRRKADRTCGESGMYPLFSPVKPTYTEMFLGLTPWRDSIPAEWMPYLAHLPLFRESIADGKQEAAVPSR